MMEALVAPFADFAFMRKALVGCLALAWSGAPIGVFMIQRRASLTGEAVAHAILPGVAIGYFLGGLSVLWMTAGGLAAGLFVALAAGAASTSRVMPGDATLAAFYLGSLALGVLLVSASGSNVDVMGFLFGTVLAISDESIVFIAVAASVSMAAMALLYRPLVMDSFDPSMLRFAGWPRILIAPAFLMLIVVNLVSGFQSLGTLMSLSLVILPAAAARYWSDAIGRQIAWAALFGSLAAFGGLLLSFHADTIAGPSIALILAGILIVSVIAGPRHGLLATLPARRHLAG